MVNDRRRAVSGVGGPWDRVEPETRYTRTRDRRHIAYQVLGQGPDLVFMPGWIFSMDTGWEWDATSRFQSRLATFSRLILFDRRGTGRSDHVEDPGQELTLEARMEDLRAALDAAGSSRAVLFATDDTFATTVMFATTFPDRVVALIGFGTSARGLWAPDYPWQWTEREWDGFIERIDDAWGTVAFAEEMARLWWPDAPQAWVDVEALARAFRRSASPRAAVALMKNYRDTDVRDLLRLVQVPTLLIHKLDDEVESVEGSRYIAKQIRGAELVELPGANHGWVAPDQDDLLDRVGMFVRRLQVEEVEFDRILTTILFTDIVGSTERVVAEGDRAWVDLLEAHHTRVRMQLSRYRGHEVDTAGDGFLATFDGPARAVRCAHAIAGSVRELGIEVRAGIHTGEVEVVEGHVRGLALHIGARVAAQASAGEVLVSSTVKDLVAGSGLAFQDRGMHGLKGVPGEWHLYAATPS